MDSTPLDSPIAPQPPKDRIQTILLIAEGMMWSTAFATSLIFSRYLGNANSLLDLLFLLLTLFYLVSPVFLFGSKGWLRGIGSHAVGLILAIYCFSWLFKAESWPYSAEMDALSSFSGIVVIAGISLLILRKRTRWSDDSFYKHIVFRLLALVLLTGSSFFSILISFR